MRMPKLVIHQEKVEDPQVLVDICPFGAMEEKDGKLSINAACKMCKLCVKKGPAGAVEYVEDEKKEEIDKSQWNGIAVYVDHVDGEIHPVTYELIGKARELASKIDHPVYALFMGNNISDKAEELLHYGVDKVFVYDFPELARFKIESYTSVFEDFIKKHQPCAIDKEKIKAHVDVLDIVKKEPEKFIESADVLVVAGRGIKKEEDLAMIRELAELLDGQVACTRPLAEAGWVEAKCQVGLSGRTVRPKLIITCGVSGAIQFVAGMDHSDCIVSINSDEKAPIFKTAHYCLVGDVYDIVPKLIEKIKAAKGA